MRTMILIRALSGNGLYPPGTLIEAPGTRSGFLICNGAAVSKAAFPELYAAIGDRFMREGDRMGTALFRLPDYVGRPGYSLPSRAEVSR